MKTLVITGGSSGVGYALVRRLVGAGHQVINLDVNAPPSAVGAFVHCDLAVESSITTALASIPDAIDGLVNVAGIARATDPTRVVAVNFLGLRLLTQELTNRLTQQGSIVSVSSIAGRDWKSRLDRIQPLLATHSMAEGLAWCEANREGFARDPYTFSKRCVTAFTLQEAQRHAGKSTRINCVSPGGIDTPLTPQFEALMGKAQSDWTNAQTGRAATPDEIAEAIEMLLFSPRWVNGVDLPVDDGYSAGIDTGWIDFQTSPVLLARAAKQK